MTDSHDRLVVNWQKLILILASLSALMIALLAGAATWGQIAGPMGLIIGAGTQNGIGGARGQDPAPLVSQSNPHRRNGD